MPDKKCEAFETKNVSHFLSVLSIFCQAFFVSNIIFVFVSSAFKIFQILIFCQVCLRFVSQGVTKMIFETLTKNGKHFLFQILNKKSLRPDKKCFPFFVSVSNIIFVKLFLSGIFCQVSP